MNIKLTHINDKAVFNVQVNPNTRRRKSQKIMLPNHRIEDYLREHYDLDGYEYLKNESDTHDLTVISTVGKFVFKKTTVDIMINGVSKKLLNYNKDSELKKNDIIEIVHFIGGG